MEQVNASAGGTTTGLYYLVEVDAPDGYTRNATAVQVLVDSTGVYANAGTANNGVRTLVGAGRVAKSVYEYVQDDGLTYVQDSGATTSSAHSYTLTDVTLTERSGTYSNGTLTWTDETDPEVLDVSYGAAGRLVEYGPTTGSSNDPYGIWNDSGWSTVRITQNYDGGTGSTYKTNLEATATTEATDLTSIFAQSTIVQVTDQSVASLEVTKEVTVEDGLTPAEGASFDFSLALADVTIESEVSQLTDEHGYAIWEANGTRYYTYPEGTTWYTKDESGNYHTVTQPTDATEVTGPKYYYANSAGDKVYITAVLSETATDGTASETEVTDTLVLSDGTLAFTLEDGQTIGFYGIEAGVEYTVTELRATLASSQSLAEYLAGLVNSALNLSAADMGNGYSLTARYAATDLTYASEGMTAQTNSDGSAATDLNGYELYSYSSGTSTGTYAYDREGGVFYEVLGSTGDTSVTRTTTLIAEEVTHADTLTFVNAYEPDSVTLDSPTATKSFREYDATNNTYTELKSWSGATFDFRLYAYSATYSDRTVAQLGDIPMPEGATKTTDSDGVVTESYKTVEVTETDKTADYGTITYTKPGTYVYTIYERTPANQLAGVTYSNALHYLTVTVTDNGDGTLTATPAYTQFTTDSGREVNQAVESVTITNTFSEATTDVAILATKTLTDNSNYTSADSPTAGAYTFELTSYGSVSGNYADNGGTIDTSDTAVESVPVTVAEGSSSRTMTMVNGAGGTVGFEYIQFTNYPHAGNSYVYTLREQIPSAATNAAYSVTYGSASDAQKAASGWTYNGVTYDSTSYYVVVYVYATTDAESSTHGLGHTITYYDSNWNLIEASEGVAAERVSFGNTYDVTSTSVTVSGQKTFDGFSIGTGTSFEDASFEFTLTPNTSASDNTAAAINAGAITYGENNTALTSAGITQTVTSGTSGSATSFDFSTLTFSRVGTYSFNVRETVPTTNALGGVTYDTHASTVTVVVTDTAFSGVRTGALTATVTYSNANARTSADQAVANKVAFTDSFEAEGAFTGISVTKEMTGRYLSGTTTNANNFKFTITGADSDTVSAADASAKLALSDASFANTRVDVLTNNKYVWTSANKLSSLTFDQGDLGKTYRYVIDEADVTTGGYDSDTSTYTLDIEVKAFPNDSSKLYTVVTLNKNTAGTDASGTAITTTTAVGSYTQLVEVEESGTTTKYYVGSDGTAVAYTGSDADTATYVELSTTESGTETATGTDLSGLVVFSNSYAASINYTATSGLSITKTLSAAAGTDSVTGTFNFKVTPVDTTALDSGGTTTTIISAAETANALGFDVLEDGTSITPKTVSTSSMTATGGSSATSTISNILSNVTFTQDNAGKTYTLEVEEKPATGAVRNDDGTFTLNGITYTAATYTVTIAVVDDGDGSTTVTTTVLNSDGTQASQVSTDGSDLAEGESRIANVAFENSYAAATTDAVTPQVTKEVTGSDAVEGKFEFTLSAANDTTKTAIDNGAVVASALTSTNNYAETATTPAIANGDSAAVTFSNMTFTAVGTYTFNVVETVAADDDTYTTGTQNAGWTMDTHTCVLTVTVTDSGTGQLVASAAYSDASDATAADPSVFTNSYGASTTYAAQGGLNIQKTLSGHALTAGLFKFQVQAYTTDQSSTAIAAANAKLDEAYGSTGGDGWSYSSHVLTVSNAAATGESTSSLTSALEPLAFTQDDAGKTFYYQVSEVNAGTGGYTYDTDHAVVAIQVVDAGDGTLYTITTVIEGTNRTTYNSQSGETTALVSFDNSYVATGSVILAANKVLNGRDMDADEFSFEVLYGTTQVATGTNAAATVTSGNTSSTGAISFSEIKFTNQESSDYGTISLADLTPSGTINGNAIYSIDLTVREVTEDLSSDVTADSASATQTVTLTVTDSGNGTYFVTSRTGTSASNALTFTNTYTPAAATHTPSVTKVLAGDRTVDLVAGEFSFTMSVAPKDGTTATTDGFTVANNTYTAANDASGNVAFNTISFTQPGTYTVRITENVPSTTEPFMTYGQHTYSYDVVVAYSYSMGAYTVTTENTTAGDSTAANTTGGSTFTNTYNSGSNTKTVSATYASSGTTVSDADGALVGVGDTLTYTIDWVNNAVDSTTGKATAATVKVEDALPDGVTLVTNSISNSGAYDSATNTITWDLGTKAAGATGSVSFQVTVDASAVTNTDNEIDNHGHVWINDGTRQETNHVTNTVPEKTVAHAEGSSSTTSGISIGDVLTYVVSWENTTGSAAEVIVTDKLPEGLEYQAVESATQPAYDESTRTLTWNLGTQEAGASGTVSFNAEVVAVSNSSTTIRNQASIQVGDNPSVSTNPVTRSVVGGALIIDKTVVAERGATIDEAKTFTFTIKLSDTSFNSELNATTSSMNDEISAEANETVQFTDGVATVELEANEQILIEGLSGGVEYTVTEVSAGTGYTTTSAGDVGTISNNGTSRASFTNTYTPTEATVVGADSLTVTKVLSGRDWVSGDNGDSFTFTLTLNTLHSETVTALANGWIVMPGENSSQSITITADSSNHAASFGNITFTHTGTYQFLVTETVPSETKGITYDADSTRVVTVNVTDDHTGALSASVSYDATAGLTFTNAYAASGTLSLSGTKSVTSSNADATYTGSLAGFQFSIAGTDEATRAAIEAGTISLPTATATSNSSGVFSFGDIAFNNVTFGANETSKTYTFTVTEATSSVAGVATAAAQEVTVTLSDTDHDGTLEVVASQDGTAIEGLSFTNTYNATTLVLSGTKSLVDAAGNSVALNGKQFSFTLAATGDTATAVSDGTVVMPSTTRVQNNGTSGEYVFGNITFKAAGTYTFAITESGSVAGVTNDSSAHTITVNVMADDAGKLSAVVTESGTSALNFTNTYGSNASATASIAGTKTLTGRTMAADEFTFELTAVDGAPMRTSADAESETSITTTNTAEGAANFGSLYYTMADLADVNYQNGVRSKVFTYTVAETNTVKGVTNDSAQTFKVTLTDNGSGVLTAAASTAGSGLGQFAFTNTYSATGTLDGIAATKTLTGRDMTAGEFTFQVLDGETVVATGTNAAAQVATGATSATSSIAFTDITFTNGTSSASNVVALSSADSTSTNASGHSTYTFNFTVQEVVSSLPDNVTANEGANSFDITVTVTDNGDGTLSTAVTYPDTTTNTLAFANTYTPDALEFTPEVTKVLTGRSIGLQADEFDFAMTITPDTTTGATEDGYSVESLTAANDAEGKVTFDTVQFSQTGTYTIAISEVVPAVNEGRQNFMNYDRHTYSYDVVVSYNNTSGAYAYTIQNETMDEDGSTFTNEYDPATPSKWVNVTYASDGTTLNYADGKMVGVGDTLTYNVFWGNTALNEQGQEVPATVAITDELPDGVELDESSLDATASYNSETRTITWTIDAAAGDTGTVSFNATVLASAVDNTDNAITNQAQVQVGDHTPIYTQEVTNYVPEKTWRNVTSGTTTTTVGDTLEYTVEWRNSNDAQANVTIADTLASGLVYASASAVTTSSGTAITPTFAQSGQELSWTFMAPANTSGTLTFQVVIDTTTVSDELDSSSVVYKNNTATVQVGTNPSVTTNTTHTTIARGALIISKTATYTKGTTAGANKTFTFDIYATDASGDPHEGTYTFYFSSLYAVDSELSEESGDADSNATVPEGTTTQQITFVDGHASVTLEADQQVVVAGLPTGTQYKVTETDPGAGYVTTVNGESVENREVSGTIVEGAAVRKAYNNTYSPTNAELTAGLTVTKVLEGRSWFDTDSFTFTLEADTSYTETATGQERGYFALSDDASMGITITNKSTAASDGSGYTASFAGVTFSHTGTFRFLVREVEPETGAISGVSYDAEPQSIVVKVSDVRSEGALQAQLVAEVVDGSDDLIFTNTYEPEAITVTPTAVTKVFAGSRSVGLQADEFSFNMTVTDADDNTVAQQTATNAADGTVAFSDLSFTETGTYHVSVNEVVPTKADQAPFMEYDEHVYSYDIVVTYDSRSGTLSAEKINATSVDDATTDVVEGGTEFTNTYASEASAKNVTKVVDGTDTNMNGKLVGIGDTLTYTISWANTAVDAMGKATAATVTVRDPLSAGLAFVSATNGGMYSDGQVTWSIEAAAGETGEVSFTVSVDASAVDNTNNAISNRAYVAVGGGSEVVTNEVTNTVPEKTVQHVDGSASGTRVGDVLEFTITWDADDAAEHTVTTDVLDEGLTYVAGSASNDGVYDAETRTVSWTFADAEAGEAHTVTFRATINELAVRTTIENVAAINVDGVSSSTNTVERRVVPDALILAKTVEFQKGTTAAGNESYEFTIVAKDSAGTALTGTYEGTISGISSSTNARTVNVTFTEGVATVSLGRDEMIEIDDLPEGATFEITETGANSGGYSTTATVNEVSVPETNDDETLVASGTISGDATTRVTFNNVYAPDDAKLSLNVNKTLTGRNWAEGDSFAFKVEAGSDSAQNSINNGYIVLPEDGTVSVTNESAYADGSTTAKTAAFGDITFTRVGVYSLKVSEVVPETGITGVTYDTAEYYLTVTVSINPENAGQLVANVTSGSTTLAFENTYTQPDPTPVSAQISATKTLTGRTMTAGEFSFTLTQTDEAGNALTGEAAYAQTATNTADGSVAFDTISYGEAGIYYYTMAEVNDGAGGVTYDSATHQVVVTVTEDDYGVLSAAVAYDGAATQPTFVNTYAGSVVTDVVSATKNVEAASGETYVLNKGAFSFTLTNTGTPAGVSAAAAQTQTNEADGSITFDEFSFSEPSTYVYTLTEDDVTATPGITKDGTVYTITYVIEDNGEGQLVIASKSMVSTDTQDGTNPRVGVRKHLQRNVC